MKGKLIGKGAFTKAYMWGDTEAFLVSMDHIKEAMAYDWFPEHRLFPEVRPTDTQGEYLMEYFPRVSSLKNNLDAEEYQLYRELRALFQGFTVPRNNYDLYSAWYKIFSTCVLSHPEAEEIREALIDALDACGNYGTDINFEISPRNVAVKDGKLILLDCFFLSSQLKEVRGTK